ncbi:MAG: septal ring lytic transglycosylase RlpA family protein [Rhodospirillaceae bacterium]|nr:septal ring lytic transglycosylase RlpA family protein [Rhodospirillaceae bacterium]
MPTTDQPAYMQLGYDSKGRVVSNYKVGTPYEVAGKWYYPGEDYGYREEGIASWYGPGFNGKRTANGEVYDMNAMTAAHKTLPMPSVVQVINLENNRSIRVRINDRGPFVDGRIIDLSRRAAQLLDVERQGTARVLVELIPDESLTLKNMAMNQSGQKFKTPKVNAAPREPVTAQLLDPPSLPSASRPSIETKKIAAKTQTSQPSASRPSIETKKIAAKTRPSQPTFQQPSVTPVTPPSPSPSIASGSRSGFNLPSVSVSTPDVGPIVESAVRSQTGLAQTAKDLLPSPKEVVNRALENGEAVQPEDMGEADRLSRPENIELPQGVFIQAGSFADINNARRLEAQLTELGNVFVSMVDVGGQVFHRVRVGPITDNTVADQLLQYMKTEGYGEARILTE